MKFFMLLITVLLSVCAFGEFDQYRSRHDGRVFFVAENAPHPFVDFDSSTNIDKPHVGGYHAGEKLFYKVQRSFYLPTVTATVTRRIVRKFSYQGNIARQPIYSYPAQVGVGILPGQHVLSFSSLELPPADKLPPGKYLVEIFVQFAYNGSLITYSSETQELEIVP